MKTHRKNARSTRHIKKRNSQNTNRKAQKKVNYRKHTQRQLTSQSKIKYKIGGADPDITYDVYSFRTKLEVCYILLIEQVQPGKIPTVYIFIDKKMTETFMNMDYGPRAEQVRHLYINNFLNRLFDNNISIPENPYAKTNYGKDRIQRQQWLEVILGGYSDTRSFSYCVAITPPSNIPFTTAVFGFRCDDIKDGEIIPKEAKDSKAIKIEKLFEVRDKSKLRSLLTKDEIVKHLGSFKNEVYEELGTLTAIGGNLKVEQIDPFFTQAEEKLHTEWYNECNRDQSEYLKLLTRFKKLQDFTEEVNNILYKKADDDSPIYTNNDEMERVKKELINDIEEVRKKYDVEHTKAFTQNEVEQIKAFFHRNFKTCKKNIQEAMGVNYDYIKDKNNSEDSHYYRDIANFTYQHSVTHQFQRVTKNGNYQIIKEEDLTSEEIVDEYIEKKKKYIKEKKEAKSLEAWQDYAVTV